jgi:hypothetical protein
MNATWAELDAVRDYNQRAADHIREQRDARRLRPPRRDRQPLPRPAPPGTPPLSAAMALMTDTERAEVEQLAALAAPDGTIAVPRTQN